MKKKITIFSSNGGGGHIAAANALIGYFSSSYDIVVANIFCETFSCFDPFPLLSFGRANGEDIYNYFLRHKWYRVINIYYRLGYLFYMARRKKVITLLRVYLEKEKPDLIISVIPIVNHAILDVAKELNIPFLLIPTDLDTTTFLEGIENPSYEKFRIASAFDTTQCLNIAQEKKIPRAHIVTTGFIVRPDFLEKKDIPQLKKFYDIPTDKPVILLLLGAMGLDTIPEFVKELTKINSKAHIIVCLGKNENLKEYIKSITIPHYISISIIGFTNRISDFIAMADLFITKSGSVSVCEGLYMNVPMILDATSPSLLNWEAYNHDFIEQHNFGTSIQKLSTLSSLVSKLLSDESMRSRYKSNLAHYEKKHVGIEVNKIIQELMEL